MVTLPMTLSNHFWHIRATFCTFGAGDVRYFKFNTHANSSLLWLGTTVADDCIACNLRQLAIFVGRHGRDRTGDEELSSLSSRHPECGEERFVLEDETFLVRGWHSVSRQLPTRRHRHTALSLVMLRRRHQLVVQVPSSATECWQDRGHLCWMWF